MIVRFKELEIEQLNSIYRGTIVLDFNMNPYVVITDNYFGWYVTPLATGSPLSMIDMIPIVDVDSGCFYIEKDDIVAFADWNVVL